MNCDPSALANAAKCFNCVPPGMQGAVQTMLTCEWANAEPGGICDDPVVNDWLTRLANDFQTMPSEATILAICDFCEALRTYGLMDKMLVVNPIIPDNFLSMRYPLIYQVGNGLSPFLNFNFAAADLDVNGIIGDGLSTYFDTGFVPFDQWGLVLDSFGLTVYQTEATIGVNDEVEIGIIETNKNMNLSSWNPSTAEIYGIGWTNASVMTNAGPEQPAFYSLNRTTTSRSDLYQNAISIENNVVLQAGDFVPDSRVYAMCLNDNLSGANLPHDWSSKRVSFLAIHEGLTAAEEADFFWSVRVLRMDLGGGFV